MLGNILTGSLLEGFKMKVVSQEALSLIKTGKFVSIAGEQAIFFAIITDLKLEVSDPDILIFPPSKEESLLLEVLKKRGLHATTELNLILMLDKRNRLMPVKMIPSHFAPVYEATEKEIALIFGDEKDKSNNYFSIGSPLDMEVPVCLNLLKLTERSNGIFGKTGTGKTFLTRILLSGLIKQKKAVNLIFDMHSEYGLQSRSENKNGAFVKGLKTLFSDQVAIFSLDPASTKRRGGTPDSAITLYYQDVSVEDVLSLSIEFNLHATAVEVAHLIAAKYKKNWLQALLESGEKLKEFAESIGAHPESVAALYRKLKRMERLPFFVKQKSDLIGATLHKKSVIDDMMSYIDRGINVIIEFGNYTSSFCYLLVANIITRRIHSLYIKKTEKFLGTQRKDDQPKQLMITIEEAHKFLNPQAAKQTIFGIIAREMRKYYVSLLVVDQRPSSIDQEILSQIGTKIVAQLSDEKDVQAVLSGVSGAQKLRAILSTLETKKQALLLGHAVTMPVVVETRSYDESFYQSMTKETIQNKNAKVLIEEIF